MPLPKSVHNSRNHSQPPYRVVDFPNFDKSRLEWGYDGLPDDTAIDPKHPHFVIKSVLFTALDGNPPRRFRAALDWNRRELLRFTYPGIALPHDFTVVQMEGTDIGAYHYVQRLTGEHPDPANPTHVPLLASLGNAALNYLEQTPVDAYFTNKFALPDHYIFGQPHFGPKQLPRFYLHDLTFVHQQHWNRREEAGQPSVNQEVDSFAQTVRDVAFHISQLPSSQQTEQLLLRADQLLRTS